MGQVKKVLTEEEKRRWREREATKTREAVVPENPFELLDEYQAAKLLRCSVYKLRRDRWAGGGVPFVKFRGAVRYRRTDIDSDIAARVRRSTSDHGQAV